ncbi:MAG: von Willebrand factor type A domain-containing protein, partial [Desulfobacterales bacterium]
MNDKEIQKKLAGLSIPEPSEAARKRAIHAAVEEFSGQTRTETKGFTHRIRLLGKILKGGPVMTRPVFATAIVVLSLGVVTFLALPNFFSYRRVSAPPLQETASRSVPAPAPAADAVRQPSPAEKVLGQSNPSAMPGLEAEANRSRLFMTKKMDAASPGALPQEYVGRDRFDHFEANPVKRAAEEPVSTFSVDVDTASYAFVRRALFNGHLPPADAVRVEELINYFDYDYPRPVDRSVPFKPTVSVFPTPWNPDTLLLHIGIKGYDVPPDKRPR